MLGSDHFDAGAVQIDGREEGLATSRARSARRARARVLVGALAPSPNMKNLP